MALRAATKPSRIRDAAYVRFLASLPCAVCVALEEKQTTRTEAHHTTTRGAGGGDDTAAPCCRQHHQQWHLLGRKTFTARTGVDLVKVAAQRWAAWQGRGGGARGGGQAGRLPGLSL